MRLLGLFILAIPLMGASSYLDSNDLRPRGELSFGSLDGSPARTCSIGNFSVGIDHSKSLASPGDPGRSFSVSTNGCLVADAALLGWIAGRKPKRSVVATIPAAGTAATVRYELDGAEVMAFTASHFGGSTEKSITLTSDHLRVNGVQVF